MDWIVEMSFAVIFGVLKQVIKNPEKKKAMQKVCVKLRDALIIAYPLD